MKFSDKTIRILKNFSTINQSIYFRKGNVLRTCDTGSYIVAKSEVTESFDRDFGIYDLPRLLSTLALFENPEIVLQDSYLTISSGKNSVKYFYTSPELIKVPKDKDLNFPASTVDFEITNDQLNTIVKACSILQAPEILLIGEDGVITLQSGNSKNSTADNFNVEIGETDANFKIKFAPERLKLIPNTYRVSLTDAGISRFESDDVTYWIAPTI